MSKFKKIISENNYKKNNTERKIIFRSNWEISFANFLENNQNVLSWESNYPIKYFDKYNKSPKIKYFYIDFYIKTIDNKHILCEIKPIHTLTPKAKTKSIKFKIIYTSNFLKNLSKFEAANLYCKRKNWEFYIVSKSNNVFNFYKWDHIKHIPIKIHSI